MSMLYKPLFAAVIVLTACSQPQKEEAEVGTEANVAAIETTEGDNDPVKAAFLKKYPNAQDVEWQEDSNGYLEANFKLNGEKYRADYTKEGVWVETERSIRFEQLPKAVQDAVNQKFDADEITEIEQVDHAERGVFYDVEFKAKGKNNDFEFSEEGQLLN